MGKNRPWPLWLSCITPASTSSNKVVEPKVDKWTQVAWAPWPGSNTKIKVQTTQAAAERLIPPAVARKVGDLIRLRSPPMLGQSMLRYAGATAQLPSRVVAWAWKNEEPGIRKNILFLKCEVEARDEYMQQGCASYSTTPRFAFSNWIKEKKIRPDPARHKSKSSESFWRPRFLQMWNCSNDKNLYWLKVIDSNKCESFIRALLFAVHITKNDDIQIT